MSPPYSQTRGFWLRDSKKVAWILNGEGRGLGFELRRLTLPTSTLRSSFSAVLQVGLPPSILLLQLSECCVCSYYLVYNNDAKISEPFLENILLNYWNKVLKKTVGTDSLVL